MKDIEKLGNILIVDDAEEILLLIQYHLKSNGFKVFTATNTQEAKRILLGNPIDILLLDVNMPGQDGYSFCRELRNIEKFQLLPILFITSVDRDMGFPEAVAHGGDDFINKPFNPKEVVAKVRAFSRIKSLQDIVFQQKMDYEKELWMARRVQEQIIPVKDFQFAGMKVKTYFRPVFQVGGDYVDAWETRADLNIFIADCSGHGPSAALIGAMLKMQLRSFSEGASLLERVTSLRENMKQVLPMDYSITFFYGMIHPDKTMEYINGGHPSPFLYKDGEVSELQGMSPLIIDITMKHDEKVFLKNLNGYQSLMLYTDGASEAMSSDDKIIGTDGLMTCYTNVIQSQGDVISSVLEGILSFCKDTKPQDDIALLSIVL